MCRFIAYSGKSILMHDLLYGPKNSLINQSVQAQEAYEPLNGDGFGIGWYNNQLDPIPGLYTSIRPAWNDRNLQLLSKKIKSELLFAHVRAANSGEVSEANCHPFYFHNFMFMHNGEIEDFPLIKRFLRRSFSDEIYNWMRGQTDSEHLFATFLNTLFRDFSKKPSVDEMVLTMTKAIESIIQLKKDYGSEGDNYINMALSDGENLICLRYVTKEVESASTLYYAIGSNYECHDGVCRMRSVDDNQEKSILVASERLTKIEKDWTMVPVNHYLIIDKNKNIQVVSFDSVNKKLIKAA